jgi:hypothetical protein
VLHPLDPDEHFIHVPLVPGPWPTAAHAPFGQQRLDVTRAEAEHVIQPHSMAEISAGKRWR